MTLKEAIKHCLEVAEKAEVDAKYINPFGETPDELGRTLASCIRCADEHRQLAEWLKELKKWRELEEVIAYSIKKNPKYNLVEWCKTWGFSIEDFERFLKEFEKE